MILDTWTSLILWNVLKVFTGRRDVMSQCSRKCSKHSCSKLIRKDELIQKENRISIRRRWNYFDNGQILMHLAMRIPLTPQEYLNGICRRKGAAMNEGGAKPFSKKINETGLIYIKNQTEFSFIDQNVLYYIIFTLGSSSSIYIYIYIEIVHHLKRQFILTNCWNKFIMAYQLSFAWYIYIYIYIYQVKFNWLKSNSLF